MAGNNLMEANTGLDHLFIGGYPVIESRVSIADVYKKAARISSLAVQADPYFFDKPEIARMFSEIHGEGDRISGDFLLEGAKDILPVFQSLQRLMPEGMFDAKSIEYEYTDLDADWSWNNPNAGGNLITSLLLKCTSGYGDITIFANGVELGTVTLPEYLIEGETYLAYDLAGWLGGESVEYFNWMHSENLRNSNTVNTISLVVSNASGDFVYDAKVLGVEQDVLGWKKALYECEDVRLPEYRDSIVVSYLKNSFTWNNINSVRVNGVTLRVIGGSAKVTISKSGEAGSEVFVSDGDIIGNDYFNDWDVATSIAVALDEASDDFRYELNIDTYLQAKLPSPRFQYNSAWDEGYIVFRWLNMDTRGSSEKLNYTTQTMRDVRVDTNNFENVENYLIEALIDYILKELYRAIGYDKKYIDYRKAYNDSRADVAYWVKNNIGYQGQYGHG